MTNLIDNIHHVKERYQIDIFTEALRLGCDVTFRYGSPDVIVAKPLMVFAGKLKDGDHNILLQCQVPDKGFRNYIAGHLSAMRLVESE